MAVLSLGIGTAQESYEAGFNDGNAEDLPKEWVQNRYENFKPYGTVRIVDAPFAETKYKKAAEVCGSESKAVDLILQRQIPVSAGDIIAIEAAFKTNAGSEARFGFYGSSKRDLMNTTPETSKQFPTTGTNVLRFWKSKSRKRKLSRSSSVQNPGQKFSIPM